MSDILRHTVPLPFLMRERSHVLKLVIAVTCIAPLIAHGQVASKATSTGGGETAERGIALASKGLCKEALPLLKKSAQTTDKNLRYDVLMATARCAMSLDQTDTVVRALLELNHAFPRDPEVLFNTAHYYSDLASRASQELAASAPTSAQAEQLEAESLESQGDLDNAAAEFVLGETARQAGEWNDAIAHFSRASKIDAGFQEAYLALGMSLNSAGRFADAVTPLETYVTMQPGDPAGHYQLGTAYARTGHKQEAQREMALQQQTAAKTPSAPSQP